ncbi:YciI family protein [Nocardioides sp. CER19]|uniref:YciI family protein n=1 Tax=Nocardioides sp. CER19 TaxID=3038538 RepID=UPI00244A9B1D|nr:YciI family protein [Nocardioides sp. CER19]MDH2412730.1 YciI family protein [Nocardioides sp. CER19]
MTQYLIAVVGEPDYATLAPEELQQIMTDVDAVVTDARAAGIFVFGGGLHGPEATTVVDASSGAPVVTDGPYAESKEQMGGFAILDVPDLDAALAWAGRLSAACRCPQEVRPFQDEPASTEAGV